MVCLLLTRCSSLIFAGKQLEDGRTLSSPTVGSSRLPAPPATGPSQATVLRALYTYITLSREKGGLNIGPHSTAYPHLDLIISPHPAPFKSSWLKRLTRDLSFGYSDEDISQMATLVSTDALPLFQPWVLKFIRSVLSVVWGTHSTILCLSNPLRACFSPASHHRDRTSLRVAGVCSAPCL